MKILVLGLVVFLLVHTVPIFPSLRAAAIARFGANGWRNLHSVLALVGFGLIVWGFGQARYEGAPMWFTQAKGMRHATLLVLLPVFPLLFTVYLPGWIKAKVGHPMVTAVILWSAGHLLFVGSAPAVTLFAAFLVWSVVDRLSLARRGGAAVVVPPFGRNDALAIALGLATYGLMVWKLHVWLIGVSPLG